MFLLYSLGLFVLQIVSMLAIIYLPITLSIWVWSYVRHHHFLFQRLFWIGTLYPGVTLGGFLIFCNLDVDIFAIQNLYRLDGPWDLTYQEFLFDRVNPMQYSFMAVLQYIQQPNSNFFFTALAFLAVLGFISMLLYSYVTLLSARVFWVFLFSLIVITWSSYMVIFMICLVFWLLNLLNFWLLGLLAMAIHLHNHHTFPFTWRIFVLPVMLLTGQPLPKKPTHNHDAGGHH